MELKPPKKCCSPNYDLTGSNRPKWGFADVAGHPLKFACLVKFIIPVNSTIASITKTIGIYVHLKNEKNTSSVIREKGCVSVCISGFYACAYQRVRNVRFLENLACFVFLKHPFLRFAYYRRATVHKLYNNWKRAILNPFFLQLVYYEKQKNLKIRADRQSIVSRLPGRNIKNNVMW